MLKVALVQNILDLVEPVEAIKPKPSKAIKIKKVADDDDVMEPPPTPVTVNQSGTSTTVVVVVSFEACKSCHRFAKKACEMFAELCELVPKDSNVQLELSINGDDGVDMKVRRGAFEISVYDKESGAAKRQEIWTGLKRGPPRSAKYPVTKSVLDDILKQFR